MQTCLLISGACLIDRFDPVCRAHEHHRHGHRHHHHHRGKENGTGYAPGAYGGGYQESVSRMVQSLIALQCKNSVMQSRIFVKLWFPCVLGSGTAGVTEQMGLGCTGSGTAPRRRAAPREEEVA